MAVPTTGTRWPAATGASLTPVTVQEAWAAVVAIWNALWSALSAILQPTIDWIKNAWQSVYDFLVGNSIIPDLVNGIIQWFTTLSTFLPFVDSGKLRIVAINGGSRYDKLPDVPTVNDILPGFERPSSWIGVFAPTGTPPAVVKRLSDEFVKQVGLPEVRARIGSLGTMADPMTSEQFGAFVRRDVESVGRLMKAAGIQPE